MKIKLFGWTHLELLDRITFLLMFGWTKLENNKVLSWTSCFILILNGCEFNIFIVVYIWSLKVNNIVGVEIFLVAQDCGVWSRN